MANSVALASLAAAAVCLQVAEVLRTALVPGHDVVHLQGPLMLVCAAAFAAAFGPGEHPDVDRATDRRAVAVPVGEHLLAALHSEGIEAMAAQLQQLVALGVAQLLAAHQAVGALVVAGDAVEGEPCPPGAADAVELVEQNPWCHGIHPCHPFASLVPYLRW